MRRIHMLARQWIGKRILVHRPAAAIELTSLVSMHPRFYCEQPIVGSDAVLSREEAHHLMHARRLAVGAIVCLFDGSGDEFLAEVVELGRTDVRLRIQQRRTVDRELPVHVTLAVPLPKGDRQQFLVEKCVELGVAHLVPVRTHHSVVDPGENTCRRLRRYVIEASKQCGRNRLMEISSPMEIVTFLGSAADPRQARWILDVGSTDETIVPIPVPTSPRIAIAIGPEAGWADQERQVAAEHQWTSISLGPRILRIETAAVAIAAWCGLPHNGS